MAVVVLDASATIAYLRGEPGKERIAAALLDDENSCRMHAVNLCEVFIERVSSYDWLLSRDLYSAMHGAQTQS